MSLYKYKIFCITENEWIYVTSAQVPTECPNNALDTIKPGSLSVIESIVYDHVLSLSPNKVKLNKTEYTDLDISYFFDSDWIERIIKIKATSFVDIQKTGSYSIRAYDRTHATVIGEITLNNEELMANDLGTLADLANEDSIIEFHAKVLDKKDKITIKNILIYYKSK
jgi:hypothetical protein